MDEGCEKPSQALGQTGQVDPAERDLFQVWLVVDDVPQVTKQAVEGDDINACVVCLLVMNHSQLFQVLIRSAVICADIFVVCQHGKEVGNRIDEVR